MELHTVKNILEAILLSVDKPMDLRQLNKLFEADEDHRPSSDQILQAIQALQADYQGRGMELAEVSSGYRIQVREDYTGWISRLWEEKAPRYSRALLETLVLIAYRQPVTRGEIEEIRGVSVSSHIMKTLLEREWVRVLGHKDVPGKPSMYGTTSGFLDYFNLKSLDELPPLSDIKDLDKLHPSLELEDEQAVKEDEAAESETSAEDVAEGDSEAGKAADQMDVPDDSYQGGVEEADEEIDEKLEQEKLAVSNESSETPDLDEADQEISEQDAEPTSEEAETAEAESIPEVHHADSVGMDVEEADEDVEQEELAVSDDSSETTGIAGPEEETSVQEVHEPDDLEPTRFDSETDNTDEQMDGSTEIHLEIVEADVGKKLEQEEQVGPYEFSEAADMDNALEETTEQDVQADLETVEILASETITELTDETDAEAQITDEHLADAAEDSPESDVEEVVQKFEQEKFAVSNEASGAAAVEEPVEETVGQDVQTPSETAKISASEAIAEVESETGNADKLMDIVDDSAEMEVETIDEEIDEGREQEEQVASYEPSETAGMDGLEPADKSPEQDVEPEPERSGWTMLAQRFWERLKRLMKKGRKRDEKEQESEPELSRFVELLTSLCYTYKYV